MFLIRMNDSSRDTYGRLSSSDTNIRDFETVKARPEKTVVYFVAGKGGNSRETGEKYPANAAATAAAVYEAERF